MTGNQCEERFSSTEDIPEADVFTYDATYLYSDGDGYYFMNSETYEQISLNSELLGDNAQYLQEEMKVQISTYNEQPIGISIPLTVTLTVMETEPEVKGATVTSSGKPAKLDTGLTVTVPAFVKEGDRIIVNTDEGTYISRSD